MTGPVDHPSRNEATQPNWQRLADTLRGSEVFDEGWYVAAFPDVAASGIDPALHFVKYGAPMGREPGPDGAVSRWRQAHPEMANELAYRTIARILDLPYAEIRPKSRRGHRKPRSGRIARAIGTAKRTIAPYVPVRVFPRAAILEANTAARAGDRAGWAKALGRYLTLQNASPFTVRDGEDNILAAIDFSPAPVVENGPLVSVIMPVWNAEDSVEYAVRSILSQSWRQLELIVVDDASTDDTPAILDRLAATDPRMTVLRNIENAGPYVSKNIGLMAARGQYITGHDADDLALPRRIERQVQFLQDNRHRCGFIGMLRMTEDGVLTRLGGNPPNSVDGITTTAFISLMIERDLMKALLGHWDVARFGADSELDKRIMKIMGVDKLPRLHKVGLLVLDSPDGLTNHPTQGYVGGRISPLRKGYRDASRRWHKKIRSQTAWLPFPHEPRRFKAPAKALNAPGVVERVIAGHMQARPDLLDTLIDCDVCILTTLRFPGGNCSSTLDELRFLSEAGLKVTLVHCVTDDRLDPVRAFERAPRYAPWAAHIVPWYEIDRLRCRHLIIRHPRAFLSRSFDRVADRITCAQAHVVVNNASHQPNGKPVYDKAALAEKAANLVCGPARILPISPMIRRDIAPDMPSGLLADEDWSPTFDVVDYALPPKEAMTPPFVIGRHGRDALEKWIEDPQSLQAAYPSGRDFKVSILGGAGEVAKRLGRVPAQWQVAEFGAVSPKDFLRDLDVFVYFPHSELAEAFGRTIVEAMIASRPVILPPRFETTFGDLAFYTDPAGVAPIVEALAADWAVTRDWLAAVQRIAIARFSSEAIARRLPDLDIAHSGGRAVDRPDDRLLSFKRRIETAGGGQTEPKEVP